MSHERHMGWGWGGARRCGWVGGPRCVCKHESEGEGEGESEQSQSGAPVKLRPAPGVASCMPQQSRWEGREGRGEGVGRAWGGAWDASKELLSGRGGLLQCLLRRVKLGDQRSQINAA